jgi:hypothetical protein
MMRSRAYDAIEGTELGETMGITHLPFAEWFERFGPPASSTYTEAHPYAQQEDNSAAETSAEEELKLGVEWLTPLLTLTPTTHRE